MLEVFTSPDYSSEFILNSCLGVRERHLESIVQRTLRHVILVAAHPRTLIQIILQIIASQEDCFASNSLHQSASVRRSTLFCLRPINHVTQKIGVLPALLQTSVLALLSSSIPLTTVMTSTSIAVDREGTLYQNPSAAATQSAASLHVFGFSSIGDLLVAECEGSFPFDTWEKAFEVAKFRCRAEDTWPDVADEDVNMDSRQVSGLEKNLKVTIQKEVSQKQQWKKELD